jgi:hypothetical protein
MKIYWYIFSYTFLIPAVLFIIWGLAFNLSYFLPKIDFLFQLWWWLIIVSFLLLITFSIYRWFKATFGLYSAVDKNDYTKTNFDNSVNVTDNNWWRIVWNFLLLSILISIISWIIWTAINLIISWLWDEWNLIETIWEIITAPEWIKANSVEQVKTYLNEYTSNFYTLSNIIWDIIKNIIQTIFSVFVIIFTYLFYIRLDKESKTSNNWNTESNKAL